MTEKYIRVEEVAKLLDVPKHAIKRLRLRGEGALPCHRIGHRTVRYLASEVTAWMRRTGRQPMNTMQAFANSEAARRAGNRQRVFDWDKAPALIAEHGAHRTYAAALSGDREWTGGTIWRNNEKVTDSYTYLSSNWATPVLIFDDDTETACWRYEDETPGWDAHTKWPDTSRQGGNQ